MRQNILQSFLSPHRYFYEKLESKNRFFWEQVHAYPNTLRSSLQRVGLVFQSGGIFLKSLSPGISTENGIGF
jgi:hypothetical protein